jgi:pimeloyl-ACP methyl ester carboxylesterase
MTSNAWRLTALLAAALFAAFDLSAAAAPALPRIELQPYRFEGGEQTLDAEKGWLTVPESRKRPGGRTIKLAVVRFKATGKNPGPPIVYLAGGPGASGIQDSRDSRFAIFQALREFGDVIAFDQRGTGESEPNMQCSDTPLRSLPLDRPVGEKEYLAAWSAQVRHCAETMRRRGIDLAAFNTEENADDVDDLRRALGAEKISMWGISYGTQLGLATIRRHGPHVHRAILAGLEGLDQTEKLPNQQQAMLETIDALVRKDPDSGVPDLTGLMRTVLSRLDKEPAFVSYPDPLTGQTYRVGLSKFDLQAATAELLTGPDFFSSLPSLYTRLAAGDWLPLALQVVPQRTGHLPATAMPFAIECASGATAARRKKIAAEAKTTLLGDAINFPFPSICAEWKVPELSDAFRRPVVSEIPVLFISGTLDGRTPPENAEEILRGFKNGVHLVLENTGHGDVLYLASPKILEAMQAFLRGQPLPEPRIAALPVPRFPKPMKAVKVAPETLAKYVGTYKIDDRNARKIFLIGDTLFSQRTGSTPVALRPLSDTEFFYENNFTQARFEMDAAGEVARMVLLLSDREQVSTKMVLTHADQTTAAATDADGLWNGWVVYAPGQTEVEVTVELGRSHDGAWAGTIDVPVKDYEFVPLRQVAVNGSEVSFEMAEPSGITAFSGRLSPDGNQLRGEIREGDAVHPFLLERKAVRPTAKPASELRNLSDDGAALKALFDQEADKVRLIFLISPTCPKCAIAARLLERYLLDQVPGDRLRVYVVWGPMLGDETEAAARKAVRNMPDERVIHFWTRSPALAKSFGVPVGLKDDTPAWDVFLLFAPGTRWIDPAPKPGDFMHQRGNLLPADHLLDAARLRDLVREMMASGPPKTSRP